MSSHISCVSTISAFLLGNSDPDLDTLCGRVASYLKMGPGLISLTSSVIAVCFGIFWGAWWFALLASLGALGSIYAIYQGHEFRELKTLEKSNRELRIQLSTFEATNLELSRQTNNLEQTNQQLAINVENMSEQNSELALTATSLREANQKQGEHIEVLKKEISDLTLLRDSLYNQANQHIGHLQKLQNSFIEIRNSAESNSNVFGEKVEILSKEVKLLTSNRISFTETTGGFEKKMSEQAEALIQAGKILNEAFLAIQKWKDQELVDNQIQQMENLNRQLSNANLELKVRIKEITQISNELYETKGILQESKSHLRELQKIKTGFELALQSLLEKIQLLGVENTNLTQVKNDICEAAKIFKEFQLNKIN